MGVHNQPSKVTFPICESFSPIFSLHYNEESSRKGQKHTKQGRLMFSTSFTLPLLLLWKACLGMPQSRSLADDAAWYRGGGRSREAAWYKGGRNSQLGRWISGGRRQGGGEKFEEEVKEKQSEELRGEEEDEEEEPAFERLTRVDEEGAGTGRNELFYDLKNIKIGVWYQWNQGRLQIINDRNTTGPLNAKLKSDSTSCPTNSTCSPSVLRTALSALPLKLSPSDTNFWVVSLSDVPATVLSDSSWRVMLVVVRLLFLVKSELNVPRP